MNGEYIYEPKLFTAIEFLQSPEGQRILVSKDATEILTIPHAAAYLYTRPGMEFLLSGKGNLASSEEFKAFLVKNPILKRMLKVESDAEEASAILNGHVECIICFEKIVKDAEPVVRMECTSKILFHKRCMDPLPKERPCMVCKGSCQIVAQDVRETTLEKKVKKRTDMRVRLVEEDMLRLSYEKGAQKAGEEALNKFMRAFENNSKDRYANLKKLENYADEAMRSLLLVQNAMSPVKFEPERRNKMKAAVEEFKRTEKALKREKDAALKQAHAAAEEAYEKYFDTHHFVRFNALEPLEDDDLTQELRCVIA